MELPSPAPEAAAASGRHAPPRRPWLAALLVLLVSYLVAYLYAGRAHRGLVVAIASSAFMVAALHGSMIAPTPSLRLLALALLLVALLLIASDAAAVAAAETRRGWVPRWYNRWWVYVACVAVPAVSPVSPFEWTRENVARAYSIPSLSMEPALLRGDLLLAAPLPAEAVARGTVVVYQGEDGGDYVARAVGTPGDTLEMRGRMLFVNGRALREPYARDSDALPDHEADEMMWQREFLVRPDSAYRPTRDHWGPLVIPDGHHFLLGDNRNTAYDSRFFGLVPRDRLSRRPVWIYFSLDREAGGARWSRIGQGIR